MADRGPSRPRHPHLEVFADLRSPHESSGARLETDFGHFREKCERFMFFFKAEFGVFTLHPRLTFGLK